MKILTNSLFVACALTFATTNGALCTDKASDIYSNLLSKRVSLVRLLADPEKYDGKPVFVDGIMHHTFEDDTLYLDREMADMGLKVNGIGLSFDYKNLSMVTENKKLSKPEDLDYFHDKCVAVYGTFSKDGVLREVSAVIENLPLKSPSKSTGK